MSNFTHLDMTFFAVFRPTALPHSTVSSGSLGRSEAVPAPPSNGPATIACQLSRREPPTHQEILTRGCAGRVSEATVDGTQQRAVHVTNLQYIGASGSHLIDEPSIDEAPFQGGRGPCVDSVRTAPDLDVRGLTGGACPPGECVWFIADSLVSQAAAGLLKGVRRAFSLTSDHRLRTIHRPGSITRVMNFPAQLLEDWCG